MTEVEIDEVFTSIAQQRIGALAVAGDTFFISRRNQIVTLAATATYFPVRWGVRFTAPSCQTPTSISVGAPTPRK
jgi:hypothetical protein